MRRARRPDDGRFSTRDAKLWRRLLKHTRYAVGAPGADTTQLHKAAEACAKAVPPPGYARRDSKFLQLAMKARQFGRLSVQDREAARDDLLALWVVCGAALAEACVPPTRTDRADIFG